MNKMNEYSCDPEHTRHVFNVMARREQTRLNEMIANRCILGVYTFFLLNMKNVRVKEH